MLLYYKFQLRYYVFFYFKGLQNGRRSKMEVRQNVSYCLGCHRIYLLNKRVQFWLDKNFLQTTNFDLPPFWSTLRGISMPGTLFESSEIVAIFFCLAKCKAAFFRYVMLGQSCQIYIVSMWWCSVSFGYLFMTFCCFLCAVHWLALAIYK